MNFFHERGMKVRGSCEGCWRRTEYLEGQGAAWLLEEHHHSHPQHLFQALLRDLFLGDFFTLVSFHLC